MMLGRKASGTDRHGMNGIARRMACAFGILVLVVLISEAVLRFAVGLGNPILIQPDPACGYILKPDQDVFRFFVHTRTNHYGMRSDEVPPVRNAGTLRILFVGDSITYGTTRVDQREIFAEVLHRDLPAIVNRPVEVLNASAAAWAPANELDYLRSRGIFSADLVLLVLNSGDLTQRRATAAEVSDDLPLKRPATALSEFYTRYIRPRMARLSRRTEAGDRIAANADLVARQNLADLGSIDALVTRQGARLIVTYIPFRRDIPEDSSGPGPVFSAWAAAHHVSMFDLTAAEVPYSAKDITLDNGVHLNARGHSIVAHAIEQAWPQVVGSR